jgi:hypothetical protein
MNEDLVYDTMFKALSNFGTLSEELKQAIIAVTDIRRFWKNDVIEESGVVCRYCYFSYSGLALSFIY